MAAMTGDAPLKAAVIYGSVRSERQGIKAARFMTGELTRRGWEATLVDPKDSYLPLLDRMYKELRDDAPQTLKDLAALYRGVDAFVIVSGEYNHSIPPALSNLLDHFLEEYFWRPSAIVCYSAGAFGGVRAAMQLRMMLGELGMPSIPSILPFPRVASAFKDDGNLSDAGYASRVDRFIAELAWFAQALRRQRAGGVPY